MEKFLNLLFLFIGVSLLAFFAFLVYAHGWASHYLSFVVLAAGSFFALRLRPSYKINLMLAVVSTVISVYAGELALVSSAAARSSFNDRKWLDFPNDFSLESLHERLKSDKKENPAFDARSKLQVVEDLNREGAVAYPAVFSEALLTLEGDGANKAFHSQVTFNGREVLPLGGISDVLTVFCNESGEYVTYKSDEHGFHNPSGIWHADAMDIIAVGDSFAHGACVPSDKSFLGLIANRYPSTLNLGIDSNGPLTLLATLKEYGRTYRPKAVLWFYYEGNDLMDLNRERLSPLLMKYLGDSFSQGLLERQDEIDRALIAYIGKAREAKQYEGKSVGWERIIKLHHLREFLALAQIRFQSDGAKSDMENTLAAFATQATEQEMKLFRSVLLDAATTVGGWGGQLYFVYLPEWARYAKPELANKNREAVLGVARSLGLPIVDMHQNFSKERDPLALFPFRRLNHYNAKGHQMVAERVLQALPRMGVASQQKSQRLVPPRHGT